MPDRWDSWRVLLAVPLVSLASAGAIVLVLNLVSPLLAMSPSPSVTPRRGERTSEMPSRQDLVGNPAPEIQGRLIGPALAQGQDFRLSDYRGQVVVIDFWASWCGPCRISTPALNELRTRHADSGLVLVGVNLDSGFNEQEVQAARESFGAEFPSIQDTEREFQSAYGVTALPTLVVIHPDGTVITTHRGGASADRLSQMVAPHLPPG